MLKEYQKRDYLPKHQKKVLLCLAKWGPMIIRETNSKLEGENTSTGRAMHELEKKGLVTKVDVKPYRGQDFPKFWLTPKGSWLALINDAKLDTVRENLLKTLKDDTELEAIKAFFGLAEADPDFAKTMCRFAFELGSYEPSEIIIHLLPDLVKIAGKSDKIINAAREYPKYWALTEGKFDKMIEALGKFKEGVKP